MGNRRVSPQSELAHTPAIESDDRFRLRHVLFFAVIGVIVWQLAPRAQAAWTLREKANQLANYALCMAGPTAPALLRDSPADFWELVRRRLVVSTPKSTPFAACAPLAEGLTESPAAVEVHHALARDFVEYAGATPAEQRSPGAAPQSIGLLDVSVRPLAALVDKAWPFEREGFARHVRPSSHAKEAPHPVEFPAAALGMGLPAGQPLYRAAWFDQGRWLLALGQARQLSVYESSDEGTSWHSVSINQPGLGLHAGRCGSFESRDAFTFESTDGQLSIHSWNGDQIQRTTRLDDDPGILSAACDQNTALLALELSGGQRAVVLCRHAGGCGQLPVNAGWLSGAFDLARIDGVSVVATADRGVVRVRSSRDNGATWTPATVAYDWHGARARSVPSRLLTLGRTLLLHGQSEAGQAYPVLVSDDYGASWHAPQDSKVFVGRN